MRNRRCRLDGGLSTGPKTQEGIERIRKARTKHGRYSSERKAARREFRQLRYLLNVLDGVRSENTCARRRHTWRR